jgi:hypothetical protein
LSDCNQGCAPETGQDLMRLKEGKKEMNKGRKGTRTKKLETDP